MSLFDLSMPLALVVKFDQLLEVLITTIIFVVIGLVVFAIAFFALDKLTPFSIRKEIEEDHNTALAIVIGSLILGIALIVSAAISG